MDDPCGKNYQELRQHNPGEFQDSVEPPVDNCLAMLRLNGLTSTYTNNHQEQPCTACGCSATNPMKRRSPSSSSSFRDPHDSFPSHAEPNPKRLFLEPDDLPLQGFSKVSLPVTMGSSPPPESHPVLRRCVSDPPAAGAFVSSPMGPVPDHSSFQVHNPNPNTPQSPDQARAAVIPVTSPSNTGLPPLPPSLRRSASDPSPSPAKARSRSPSSGDVSVGLTKKESPNSKMRLRRMKACMREISKWCREVAREPDVEEAEETHNNAARKDESGPDAEESVFVERVGEALTIHFKCPCGKGYQILFAGSDCYYKLM